MRRRGRMISTRQNQPKPLWIVPVRLDLDGGTFDRPCLAVTGAMPDRGVKVVQRQKPLIVRSRNHSDDTRPTLMPRDTSTL